MEPVRVLMVAIGGYGFHYLQALLDEVPRASASLAGVVDPEAERSAAWPRVAELGVPVCPRMEDYFAAGHHADLAVVVSPIQHHVPQSLVALDHGCDVLCDKPLGATIQDALALIRRRDETGRHVLVGYQWSFSDAIRSLKRDILAGLFGRPTRFSALCCWPRDWGYYRRNDWAGRLHDAEHRPVLDSPANNAMAHYLHNLLFLAGPAADRSARPQEVQAELYRAYPIESCDTAACRAETEDGLEILFYASHATETAIQPSFLLEFEDGCVRFGNGGRTVAAEDRHGRRKDYGAPDDTWQFRKLTAAIDGVHGRAPVACGPDAAAAQTLTVNGMHESVREIAEFPAQVVIDHGGRLAVRGLAETLTDCYRAHVLPAEAGAGWAVSGERIDLATYRWFPATPAVEAWSRR